MGGVGSVEKANMKRYSVSFFFFGRGSINSTSRAWGGGPPPCLGNYELVSTASSSSIGKELTDSRTRRQSEAIKGRNGSKIAKSEEISAWSSRGGEVVVEKEM